MDPDELKILNSFCNGQTSSVHSLNKLVQELLVVYARYGLVNNTGNQNNILKIIYQLDVNMNAIIGAYATSLTTSGVFETAIHKTEQTYKNGLMTKKLRDITLEKINLNREALRKEATFIVSSAAYHDFGGGKEIKIITPQDWVNAMLTLGKWSSEIKDILYIIHSLSAEDRAIMEDECNAKENGKCDLPCVIKKGWKGDYCGFVGLDY